MSSTPLVTVICLCYNHAPYVREAILSVLSQTYSPIEIIVVDDCSTDNSRDIIDSLVREHPEIIKLYLANNLGNNRAFNKAYTFAKGDYIIDFSTDDVLMPNRIAIGVTAFTHSTPDVGVHFCNAKIIDKKGIFQSYFYPLDSHGKALHPPKEGDVFKELVSTYFICSPTMMVRRSVFDTLNGYDDTLSYEDFDFWVRSSRKFLYCYTDEVLVKRRRLKESMSSRQYSFNSVQMVCTLKVLRKVSALVKSEGERNALKKRIYLEMRQCIKLFRVSLLWKYLVFLKSL